MDDKAQRRERIATAAMQGIIQTLDKWSSKMPIEKMVANQAIAFADALIAELDKADE